MKAVERGRNDWVIVLIVLIIGFLCVLAAGQLALRFAPDWLLNTNMDSHLDPNSDFLTQRPAGFIQAIDPAILTQPSWLNVFLTPGASFVTGTPFPASTSTPLASSGPTMIAAATDTVVVAKSPTNTLIYIPPTRTPVSNPVNTSTNTPSSQTTSTNTSTAMQTSTATPTPTTTGTSTATPTVTATATATLTATITPTLVVTDATPGEIGTTPDGTIYDLYAPGTLTLGINLVADGDADFDLVYYERSGGSGILLDWVIIEIGNGNSWYTIFNWGDNIDDTNTNVYSYISANPQTPSEPDQRDIPSAALYNNSTGIAIDVDSIVPPGNYSYIRFRLPVMTGDIDNKMEIDAIEIISPP